MHSSYTQEHIQQTHTMGNAFYPQVSIQPNYSEYLGRGSFGFVYKGTYGDQSVAVKAINRHMLKEKYHNTDKNELIPFLKGLKHPNVVSILAWEDKGHELWLALELCDCGLDKYVKETELTDQQTCNVLQQATHGLAYLHRNNIIHRDVRPDNMLVIKHDSRPRVKLTDFSLCKDVDDQAGSTMTTVWGNPFWLAPELLLEDGNRASEVRYKRSIDIFSFALVIIYVCTNHTGREKINRAGCGAKVKAGEDALALFIDLWKSNSLKNRFLPLLKRMMKLHPNARPTMEDVGCFFGYQVSSAVPRLKPLAVCNIKYKSLIRVGLGGDNHVFMGSEHDQSMRLLQLQDGGYRKVWQKSSPPEEEYDTAWTTMHVIEGSLITYNWIKDRIYCRDMELSSLHEHKAEGSLKLIEVLPPHTLVYTDEIERGSYALRLYDGDQQVMILVAAAGTWWDECLSMCRLASSGWMAVCESRNSCINVYDLGGHRHHVSVNYRPGWDAISCTDTHLFVNEYESTMLHTHTWTGQEVARVDVGHMMKLEKAINTVFNVCVCKEKVLHVAWGKVGDDVCKVTTLCAFTIL